jgi:tetratricopeptide (TPR) repeat protein
VALLPLAPAQAPDAPVAAALSELLGQYLLRTTSSVDGNRIAHALRQLGYDRAAAERHPARVAESLAVKHLLSGALARDGERVQLKLALLDPRSPNAATAAAGSGWVTVEALPLASAQLLAQLGVIPPQHQAPPSWPEQPKVLDAYGRGLLAAQGGDAKTAAAAFADANRDAPGFAPAWQHRIEAVQADLPEQAPALARQATAALAKDSSDAAIVVRAWSALLDGDAKHAATLLEPLVRAVPSDHGVSLLLARAQTEAGDYAAARATLEPVVAGDGQNGAAWLLLGRGAIRAGEAQRGVDEYLVRAQVAFTRLGDAHGQADTLNGLGVGYERLGLIEAAAQHFSDAAALRERLGDARGAAQSLRNHSSVRAVTGDYAGGEAALDHARGLLQTQGDQGALADLDNAAGVLEEERGDFAKALAAYRSALALRQGLGDHALIAESLINVGFCYYQSGEFDDAGVYWQQAQDEAAKAEDLPGKIRAAQSLSLWQVARGDWPAARKLLDESLAGAEEQQMLEETAVSLAGLAELDRLEGRVNDALAQSARAAELFRQRQDQRGSAEMALLQSAVYLGLGAWPQAEQALAPLAKSAPSDREQRALLALRQGELALGRGDRAQAQNLAATALSEAMAVHSEAVAMPARLLAVEAEAGVGDNAAARSALSAAQAALALLPAPEAAARYRRVRELLAPLPAYARAYELHQRGARALKASGDASGAAEALRLGQAALTQLNAQTPANLRAALAAASAPTQKSTP